MLTFGLGAGLPLVLLGRCLMSSCCAGVAACRLPAKRLSKRSDCSDRNRAVGRNGLDRSLEAGLVDISPQWVDEHYDSLLRVAG